MLTSGPGQTSSSQDVRLAHLPFPRAPDTAFLFPNRYPPDIIKTEINWVIGVTLGAFAFGILLTLGLNCLRALWSLPPQTGFLNQRRLLMVHVFLQIVANAVFQINSLRENMYAIFYTRPEELTYFYLDAWNVLIVFLFALTDGMLVWRCYMVQKALLLPKGERIIWHHLSWLFPLGLWLVVVSKYAASNFLENLSQGENSHSGIQSRSDGLNHPAFGTG